MINMKPKVYQALSAICDNLSNGYPNDWESFPVMQYTEEDNKTIVKLYGQEQVAYFRYCVHIWTKNTSTTSIASQTDAAFEKLGFERCNSVDVDEANGLKHKILRYEARVDTDFNVYDPK